MKEIISATIVDGFITHDGFKLERASQPATNQYGYVEYDSWYDAVEDGATIFVSDYGQPHVDAHRKPA